MLPEMDGLTVCKKVRASLDIPILMLTAKDEEIDKILGEDLVDIPSISTTEIQKQIEQGNYAVDAENIVKRVIEETGNTEVEFKNTLSDFVHKQINEKKGKTNKRS